MAANKQDERKSNAGRKKKTPHDDIEAIAKKKSQQEGKFAAKLADNIDKFHNAMYEIALIDKKASMTNKISAIKWCKEYLDEYVSDEDIYTPKEENTAEDEESNAPLISLVADNS